jgi:HKD family nuclease
MESQLLTGTTELAKVFSIWSRKAKHIRIVTAWATMDCAVYDSLEKARSKISTMVVGLDFHSTSPLFLENFWSNVRVGEVIGPGTFHPKLYLFENGGQSCCIIGSSNFTSGGFGDNTELNICIEGKTSDRFFRQVTRFVDQQEKSSDRINSAVFHEYQTRYKEYRSARQRLAKFSASKKAKARAKAKLSREAGGEEPPDQLNKTWPEFANLILAPKRKERVIRNKPDEPGYLETAEQCQSLFALHGYLSNMGIDERQFVGGTSSKAGWFGSMKGRGFFKQCLNDNPKSLDAALNHVPLKGAVSKRQFDAFADKYQWNGAAPGTASRLLAMKRPDLFICINSKNRAKIAAAFGVSASSLRRFEGYWELMQRVWSCPWSKAPPPSGELHRRVWRARVALLDSLYYVE